MDFIASPLGVLLILGFVAVAAVSFQPQKYVGVWREIAARYESERQPLSTVFQGEEVTIGRAEFAHIDASLDDEGFWMVYSGPDANKAPACSLIPWDCIRFKEELDNRYVFQIRLKKPTPFLVSRELGMALKRRSSTMPAGVSE
jgi:hypothetical protein